jgi:hypothetical protein
MASNSASLETLERHVAGALGDRLLKRFRLFQRFRQDRRPTAHQRVICFCQLFACARNELCNEKAKRLRRADDRLVVEEIEQEWPNRLLFVGATEIEEDDRDAARCHHPQAWPFVRFRGGLSSSGTAVMRGLSPH